MIIDIHAHPVLLDVINEDPEDLSFRKQQFGVFKSGRNPIEFEKLLIDDARIDKVVWLPEDYSTQMGRPIVSNEEMEKIVASCPERFIGFASIDPRDPKAKEKLTYAFETQKLSGLKFMKFVRSITNQSCSTLVTVGNRVLLPSIQNRSFLKM